MLNNNLYDTVGATEDDTELSDKIIIVEVKEQEKNGDYSQLKIPGSETVQLYQTLSVVKDPNIPLIKQGKIKVKDLRR